MCIVRMYLSVRILSNLFFPQRLLSFSDCTRIHGLCVFICERRWIYVFLLNMSWMNEWIKKANERTKFFAKKDQSKHDLALRGFYFIPSTALNCKSEPVMLAFMVWTTARIIHHMCCVTAYTHFRMRRACVVCWCAFLSLFHSLFRSLRKRFF